MLPLANRQILTLDQPIMPFDLSTAPAQTTTRASDAPERSPSAPPSRGTRLHDAPFALVGTSDVLPNAWPAGGAGRCSRSPASRLHGVEDRSGRP